MDSKRQSPKLPALPPLQVQPQTFRRRRPPPLPPREIITSPVTPTSGTSFNIVPMRPNDSPFQPSFNSAYSSPFVSEKNNTTGDCRRFIDLL